jgi:hypothetical protein
VLIAILNAVLWFLASDPAIRQVVFSVALTTAFLILFGSLVALRDVDSLGFSNGKFLVISPLTGMFLSVYAAACGWRLWTQLGFLCVLLQIAMGLLDAGEASNNPWISGCSLGVVLGTLSVAAYWAKSWNSRP